MRKKLNDDKDNKRCNKFSSILKIHEEKMFEFSETFKNKKIKDLNNSITKNIENINLLNKDIALFIANNQRWSNEYIALTNKVNHLENCNIQMRQEIKDIKSNKNEQYYIINTCNLINEFMLLEDKERELMVKENVEQELYEINQRKNDITDDYMKIISPEYMSFRKLKSNNSDDICTNCNSYLILSDGYSVCYDCGLSKNLLQHSDSLGYKELQELEYRPQFTYQKSTHLEDWLRRFQAKENKEIPQDILDKVVLEAHKQRVKDLSTLTELQVKKYLKKLELNDYYDNVISIINRINKRPPFVLTQEVETKIKEMFQQIQEPFEKYKDPNRKNMLSYSYLLHHFFLILGLPQFSKYFFLLKSPEKLRQQDQTFKKIVEELAKTDPKTPWKFYPSI
jgi:hypothetical protein